MIAGGVSVLALLLIVLLIVLLTEDEQLVYVFEIVRHGARAPMLTAPEGFNYGFD